MITNCNLGRGVKVSNPHLVNLYNSEVGDNTTIGTFVELGGCKIGNNCSIQAFAFIPAGITIGNNCFIGPRVTFTNDKYPPSRGKHWMPVKVNDNVSIAAGAIILPGVTIGTGAKIGAGAIVTKDVKPGDTIVGNPGVSL